MRAAVVLLGLLTSACAFQSQLERVAVDQNEMVANNANELVLLNILRARDREPLHFTAINKLFGDASLSGTAKANMAIKGPTPTEKMNSEGIVTETSTAAGTEVATPELSLTLGGKSSVDIGVFDSQEFYQGITGSLPAGTLAHYLHQGWSDELFTYLFVSQVDFAVSEKIDEKSASGLKKKLGKKGRKGWILESLINDPDNPTEAAEFRGFVNCYRLTHYPRTAKDQKLVPLNSLTKLSLADLALLDGEKFDVDDVPAPAANGNAPQPPAERWIKRRGKGGDGLALRRVTDHWEEGEGARCGTRARIHPSEAEREAEMAARKGLVPEVKANRFKAKTEAAADDRDAAADHQDPNVLFLDPAADDEHQGTVASGTYELELVNENGGREVVGVPVDVQVVLRSIDGVIYFLGEYLRAQTPREPYLLYTHEAGYVPILRVTPERPARSFVSARFRRERYYVPASVNGSLTPAGRSSQVFTLVQQLVNLQKTVKERPTTQTVRVLQ